MPGAGSQLLPGPCRAASTLVTVPWARRCGHFPRGWPLAPSHSSPVSPGGSERRAGDQRMLRRGWVFKEASLQHLCPGVWGLFLGMGREAFPAGKSSLVLCFHESKHLTGCLPLGIREVGGFPELEERWIGFGHAKLFPENRSLLLLTDSVTFRCKPRQDTSSSQVQAT